MKHKALLYVHGMGGSAAETEAYRSCLPGWEIAGVEMDDFTPWGAQKPITDAFTAIRRQHKSVALLANSIGAYFSMLALSGEEIEHAFFVSPVVDLERLILDMMAAAGVSEDELRRRGTIEINGAVLSWKYLLFVREHLIVWNAPTEILYAEGDALIPRDSVETFAASHHAGLTVMSGGEHWFHTAEQMEFLRDWLVRVSS